MLPPRGFTISIGFMGWSLRLAGSLALGEPRGLAQLLSFPGSRQRLPGGWPGSGYHPFSLRPVLRFARFRKTRARAHTSLCTYRLLRQCCSCCSCCWFCLRRFGCQYSWCLFVPAPVLCWHGVVLSLLVGAVAPMLRLKPLTVASFISRPTLGRMGGATDKDVHAQCASKV